jgi:DNA-binding LacI/PurR family transcriptional regulator
MIAKKAGVSNATVSLVLSGNPQAQIAAGTRERVLTIAEELGYMAPLLARKASARTGNIGYILQPPANGIGGDTAYLTNFRHGLFDELAREEFDLLVATFDPLEELPALIRQRKVDGVIVDAYVEDAWLATIAAHLPVVLVSSAYRGRVRVDEVRSDGVMGSRQVVEHLIGLGHRQIALFGLGPNASPYFAPRIAGYEHALQEAGLPRRPEYRALPEARTRTLEEVVVRAREALHLWNTLHEPPTAVFALNDVYALGLCSAARSLGIEVPAQLSVVGYDNSFAGQCHHPPLTTVDQRADAIAQAAVLLLKERIDRPERPTMSLSVASDLLVRGTTAPPGGIGNQFSVASSQ